MVRVNQIFSLGFCKDENRSNNKYSVIRNSRLTPAAKGNGITRY